MAKRDFNNAHELVEAIVSEGTPVESVPNDDTGNSLYKGMRLTAETKVVEDFNNLAIEKKETTGFLFTMMWEIFQTATPEQKRNAAKLIKERSTVDKW